MTILNNTSLNSKPFLKLWIASQPSTLRGALPSIFFLSRGEATKIVAESKAGNVESLLIQMPLHLFQ